MPGFIPFVEEFLDIKLDLAEQREQITQQLAPPSRNEGFCKAVEQAFSPSNYSFDDADRAVHSHGQATADEVYLALYGQLPRAVDMVFFCESDNDAEKLVNLAREHDVCLIPYGGGTNVSGCLKLPPTEKRMIVSVDTQRMNAIEWVNRENRQACVQAGITGAELERRLREKGLTCGHEPDSIEFSTLGGWISTNASGMKKNRYGNIEDIVERITMVTPAGKLETLEAFPRQSAGVQIRPMLFGSEGNFGLITKAVLKVRELPEKQTYQSVLFPTVEQGVEFLKELSTSSFLPSSIRLVDNAQFRFGLALKPASSPLGKAKSKLEKVFLEKVKGIDTSTMAVATVVMEGSAIEVASQEEAIDDLARKHKGLLAGGHNGKRGYNLTFAIAYIRDFLTKMHVMGETFETSVPWDKIHEVNRAVIEETKRIHEEFKLPGKPFISFRVTQVYNSGACVYYTYGVYTKGVADANRLTAQADHRLRQTIVDHGGAISHHHGVGKSRVDILRQILPPQHAALIESMKRELDPANVFGAQNGVFYQTGD
jgi:alkyldihydroxyacetonephosphate synthase